MAPTKPGPTFASSSKAKSGKTKKDGKSQLGAPSQHNQPSRKGKKAWRKNVDLEEIETVMEELREEERVTGTYLHKQTDEQLFVVDVKGDEQVRKRAPKFKASQLTSAKILTQRSAVPAVASRTTSSKKRKSPLSSTDKDRLLRMAKRPRRGPLNTILDPTEQGSAGQELSEAVKQSGTYNAWEVVEATEVKDGLETVQPKSIKAPAHGHLRDKIHAPAILQPHQGTSYNPPVLAHQELLNQAVEVEERKAEKAAQLDADKVKFEQMRAAEAEVVEGMPTGMKLDEVVSDEDNDEGDVVSELLPKKAPERKTKAQRNKASKLLAEKRARIDSARRKAEHAVAHNSRQLRRAAEETASIREKARALKRSQLQERLKQGLGGQKLGKHKVPEGEIDVQLGEDLSESLRGLKPEGNLFRDRFTSLQQRALIEPRVPVLPKRRKNRAVEYEKHAWKRFE